jgi:hypothetical protein
MVVNMGPLLAKDGAYLLVKFDQRDRQVIVRTKVCLDLPDRSLNEPPQSQICIDMTTARLRLGHRRDAVAAGDLGWRVLRERRLCRQWLAG